MNIIVEQVKEKFAALRFYHPFEGAPCSIQASDCLSDDSGIRFQPKNESDNEDKKNVRKDSAQVVRKYEGKSKLVRERCGNIETIRMELPWKRTLCDKCLSEHLQKVEYRKADQKRQIQELKDKPKEKQQ